MNLRWFFCKKKFATEEDCKKKFDHCDHHCFKRFEIDPRYSDSFFIAYFDDAPPTPIRARSSSMQSTELHS